MVVLINRRPPRSTRTDTLCPDTRPFRSAIAPIGDERPPLAIGHRAAGEGMRRQKRGKARTFTVECKAVASMSDIHDVFGAMHPAHRRRRAGYGRKARRKPPQFTPKSGYVHRPDLRAELLPLDEMPVCVMTQCRSPYPRRDAR